MCHFRWLWCKFNTFVLVYNIKFGGEAFEVMAVKGLVLISFSVQLHEELETTSAWGWTEARQKIFAVALCDRDNGKCLILSSFPHQKEEQSYSGGFFQCDIYILTIYYPISSRCLQSKSLCQSSCSSPHWKEKPWWTTISTGSHKHVWPICCLSSSSPSTDSRQYSGEMRSHDLTHTDHPHPHLNCTVTNYLHCTIFLLFQPCVCPSVQHGIHQPAAQ